MWCTEWEVIFVGKFDYLPYGSLTCARKSLSYDFERDTHCMLYNGILWMLDAFYAMMSTYFLELSWKVSPKWKAYSSNCVFESGSNCTVLKKFIGWCNLETLCKPHQGRLRSPWVWRECKQRQQQALRQFHRVPRSLPSWKPLLLPCISGWAHSGCL